MYGLAWSYQLGVLCNFDLGADQTLWLTPAPSRVKGNPRSDCKSMYATRRTLARGHLPSLGGCAGTARGTVEALTPGVCCVAMLMSCNLQPEGFLKNQH